MLKARSREQNAPLSSIAVQQTEARLEARVRELPHRPGKPDHCYRKGITQKDGNQAGGQK